MKKYLARLVCLVGAAGLAASLSARQNAPPFNPQGQPNRNQQGPWNNDVLVFRFAEGRAEQLASFERAGVPTATRMRDGRLIAAHQHFPENNDADFDKVAVHFSSDEGRTWTPAAVIRVNGLPAGMRFPFDPTLVTLPDGRVRIYFTSVQQRMFDSTRGVPAGLPEIRSAISTDGVNYAMESGVRFAIDRRSVIDCAVVLHRGVFHLFAPDNGAGLPPGTPGGTPMNNPQDRPIDGVGYHATSADGLTFTRVDDVKIDGRRRWLGNAQSDGTAITFFGSGDPGIWFATSTDGTRWTLDPAGVRVQGADPGAVRLKDGGWLLVVTGPPRRR